MMKKTIYFLTTCAILFSLGSCNSNKDSTAAADSVNRAKDITPNTMARGTLGVKVSDAEFATRAASNGMAEVEFSKIAVENAANTQLKYFARMIIRDYGKTNKELASIAEKKNISLPLTLDDEDQKKSIELNEKSRADFDKAYIETIANKNKKALKLMQDESKDGKDADVRTFATKAVSIAQSHLNMINVIHDSLK